MTFEFKPCPFCGTSDRVHIRVENASSYYWVECAHCDSRTTYSKDKLRAAAAWNRRAGDGHPCILDDEWAQSA